MDKLIEGIYTTGISFRAVGEAEARNHRAKKLNLPNFDKYGHILTEDAGRQGMNYLPYFRNEVFGAVVERNNKGTFAH
ncbi:MAG TPA: hypothetical protein VK179_10810 [Bacteroidales bacterium]|nr:hypothetical protein [Bacteroidales bacterium]